MSTHSSYNTKQKELLIDYLKASPDVHITAGDVVDHLRKQGCSIGQSTVYRQLERLVDEGVITKYTIDANTPACFEYVGKDSHEDPKWCFHCKCERCGRLIHLHCSELSSIGAHLAADHGFYLNPMRTVFYGLCDACAEAEAAEE